MPLESVKSLCEKAGIEPASREIPEQPQGLIPPGPESYVLHDTSLRHVRIVLDCDCRPTQKNYLWYDGYLEWFGGDHEKKGGGLSMLMTGAELERHKERLYRFAHEEIAAFNIAQIDTGLAVIAYLNEKNCARDPVIAVTRREEFGDGARIIVLPNMAALPTGLSGPSQQTEHRLAL